MKVVQIIKDNINQGVKDNSENTMISYNIFVDDVLFPNTLHSTLTVMVASTEALYIILGFPKLED